MSDPVASKFRIQKTALNHALKYRAPLGRYGEGHGAKEGHYYLTDGRGHYAISNEPTAASALAMMRRRGFGSSFKIQ